jgi:CheY-like chemotaxis protein
VVPGDGTKTILLVEGNLLFRKVLHVILERGGFAVLTASSAKEAILVEVNFPGPIHLLLSEVMMTDIMGPDLATAMKERRAGHACDTDVSLSRWSAPASKLRLAFHQESLPNHRIANQGERCFAWRIAGTGYGLF